MIVYTFYSAYGAIDRHNKQRQDNIEIEWNLRTKDWRKGLNASIFGMIVDDAMNVQQSFAGPEYIAYYPNEWFAVLSRELTNNEVK